jgi:enoyl-CoA hydratase
MPATRQAVTQADIPVVLTPFPTPMPDYRSLSVTIVDYVAEVVLRGPGKGNALGPDFWREMPEVFEALDRDDSVRVVILYGANDTFTYGLDLPGMRGELRYALDGHNLASERTNFLDQLTTLQRATTNVMQCRKPVIAAVVGWCVGAGVDLACAADIRLCSADAKFSVRAVRVGIVEDVGSLQLLPQIIGEGMARELAFTGIDIGATRAREIHLVNHVYETPEQTLENARAMAHQIVENPPLVVQGVKRVMNERAYKGVGESMHYTALWNAAFMQSRDFTEALTAFLEKRTPKFEGR